MAAYNVRLTRTASATLSLGVITAFATRPRRTSWYDVILGSDATPADAAFRYLLQRCTAAGTSTAVTPQALNPADVATEQLAGENHTIDATYTASAFLLTIALNQRSTFRWVANPGGELIAPATSANGIGIQTPTAGGLVAIAGTVHYTE